MGRACQQTDWFNPAGTGGRQHVLRNMICTRLASNLHTIRQIAMITVCAVPQLLFQLQTPTHLEDAAHQHQRMLLLRPARTAAAAAAAAKQLLLMLP